MIPRHKITGRPPILSLPPRPGYTPLTQMTTPMAIAHRTQPAPRPQAISPPPPPPAELAGRDVARVRHATHAMSTMIPRHKITVRPPILSLPHRAGYNPVTKVTRPMAIAHLTHRTGWYC